MYLRGSRHHARSLERISVACGVMECCQSGRDCKLLWKARFCEMSEPCSEDDLEVSPCVWEDVQEKMTVTLTSEESVQADDSSGN